MRIGTRLFLSFFLILLIMAGAGFYMVGVYQNALRDAVGQGSVFLAEDKIRHIDKDIFQRIEEIQLYSNNFLLRKALQESNRGFESMEDVQAHIQEKDTEWVSTPKEVITPFMEELISNEISESLRQEFIGFWEKKHGYRVYGEAFATNRYGANIAQTGKTSDYYQADEKWWQEAKEKGFSIGEMEYDGSAEVWTIPFGVRIEDGEGTFLGVIKAVPFVREFAREVELTTRKYETTEIRLVTFEGKLVYSTHAFQFLEDVAGNEFFRNITPESGFFIANEGGREKLFAYAHSKGFLDVPEFHWILLMAHDTQEVFSSVHNLQRALGIIGLVLALGILVLLAVLSRAISKPVQILMEGALRIANGDLSVKIDISTKDEIGQLALAFNEMTERLKTSYENLELKVRERTQELHGQIQELDKTAKLLVGRDWELSKTKEREQDRLGELDAISKRLVKRDFELLQTNELLREMDEAKSRFVSIAAHQLRTPISAMKWSVQMLLDGDFGKLSRQAKKVLEETAFTLERLIRLVGDLLNVARIEEGRFGFSFGEVQLEELCKKVLEENLPNAKKCKITLKLSIPAKPLPPVYGDSDNLLLVLENFLENALLYTPQGGVVEFIVRRDTRNHKKIRVFIKDTGIGIPEFQQGLVGQKFFRADNVVRKQIGGTGLGLYIVTKILERHHTTFEVESEEGEGSTFSFALPILDR